MPNPYGVAELSVQEVEKKRQAGESFVWLDVREPNELQAAYIDDERVVELPVSRLSAYQLDAIPEELAEKDQEVIVFCHYGGRSAQVAAWLSQQGWTNVHNMAGGIGAWAEEIDPDVGTY